VSNVIIVIIIFELSHSDLIREVICEAVIDVDEGRIAVSCFLLFFPASTIFFKKKKK